jgi:trehalose 6-phosphate synthase
MWSFHEVAPELPAQDSPRIVIVSNRVGVSERKRNAAAGGLATALGDALRRKRWLWFGWSGAVADAPAEAARVEPRGRNAVALIDLTPAEKEQYYSGFSNRVLWPNMHYRPGLTEFSRAEYACYRDVNRRFATALLPLLEESDLVWVHDYHLIPLAHELRKAGYHGRIGYFHHIPWPPPELFGALPFSGELMGALAAYDIVGLQTAVDARNAVSGLVELAGGEANGGVVRIGARRAEIHALPIGIDALAFRRLAERSGDMVHPAVRRAFPMQGGQRMVIGVDRLDYSKGIVPRMEAFAQFLRDHPEQRRQVSLLQIAPPSRADVPEYAELDRLSDETAGRINAGLAELDWTPIRVVKRTYARPLLAALFRRAAVGLVTPMRDGMNLVAKEFVAAQDATDPGVLVLSRFAGSARQMTAALIVNPYDNQDVADAIAAALAMGIEERRRRHAELFESVAAEDARWWAGQFLARLEQREA